MTAGPQRRSLKPGTRLSPNLTVLGGIDPGSADPVHIVWNHEAWCPMACKVFQSPARARREAAILSDLAHPNIMRCLGLEPPGFLLMPYLEGGTLATRIDSAPGGRLAVAAALRIALHAGAALQHVHARGYVHLDVKPCNLILANGRLPVLFDFGTARRIGARRPPEITGTDPYISPEECRKQPTGPAADVFGLAVMLYETIAGHLPFGEPTATMPFPQLSRPLQPLRKHRPGSPAALEALLASCLVSDPGQRPALDDLLPELNALIASGPRMWPAGFSPAG